MEANLPNGSILFLDGARGRYIPRDFAEVVDRSCVEGVRDQEWDVLEAGPDHEWYWETWDWFENNAVVTLHDEEFNLYHNGDLWLIPVDAEWPDQNFAEPEDIFIP